MGGVRGGEDLLLGVDLARGLALYLVLGVAEFVGRMSVSFR